MAKFVQGNELNLYVENIIKQATESLFIISPYIKLHHRYKNTLLTQKKNNKLQITLVFGKNENDYKKSMHEEDFLFFSEFPNIEIRYEERLHAKFYANERSSLLTSMNLYEFSQDNNIEAGIFLESSAIKMISNNKSIDEQAFDFFQKVAENSKLLFKKEPQYSKSAIGFRKKYTESIITENLIDDIIKSNKQVDSFFKEEKITYKKEKTKKEFETKNTGYCIRCKEKISLDPRYPFCKSCFKSWNYYQNEDFPENYCHICGKEIETNKLKPTCYPCYKNNKRKLSFNL